MVHWTFFQVISRPFRSKTCIRTINKLNKKILPSYMKLASFSTSWPSKIDAESLPESVINQFQENGVVCIRECFNTQWQEIAHRGIEKCFNNPSKYCDWIIGDDGDGIYFNDYLRWEEVEDLRKFAFESPAGMLAGKLMKSKLSMFFHEHMFVKKGGKNKAAPWHHDQAYYPINGMQNCTIWMPTTTVTKETCLQFVKGSHLWGKWFYPKKFTSHSNYVVDQKEAFEFEYEDVPDISGGKYEILSWDLEPGDCIAFHMKTLHATTSTSATIPRYVLATRWLGDDATYARRPWKSSPPPEILPKDLKLGSKVSESKGFPVIWQRG